MKGSSEFSDTVYPLLSLLFGIIIVVGFGVYVVIYARRNKIDVAAKNLDMFLTARKTVGWVSIGWSFYASAVGSAVVTGPAEIGYFGGVLSVFAYAFAAALPILLIAFVAPKIQEMYPEVLSLSDFIRFRFKGRKTQVFVVILTLLNMSAAIIVEYTTLSSLYSDFVGLGDFAVFFVLLVATVTLTYTSIGGLRASIITDQAQASASVILGLIIITFVAIEFDREDIKEQQVKDNKTISEFLFLDDNKGFNSAGYSTMFTLPLSLTAATLFSEAMWQRTWAAVDVKSLQKGAVMGALLVFCLVSTFGVMGVLVRWAGIVRIEDIDDNFNTNLFAFQIFSSQHGKALVSSFIAMLVLMLATTLAEGALDSLQNGIEASISGAIKDQFSDEINLKLARVLLVVMNIPFIIIGLQKFSILSVFLFTNMICVNAFIPIVISFFKHDVLDQLHRDWIPLFCFTVCIIFVSVFAEFSTEGSFGKGILYAFWENTLYEYQYFLFSIILSAFVTTAVYGGVYFYNKNDIELLQKEIKDTCSPLLNPGTPISQHTL